MKTKQTFSISQTLDVSKTYSYADYLLWTFQERIELIKGKIFKMSPAPNTQHQIISGEIFYAFRHFLDSKKCKVFAAPFDVRLPSKQKETDDKEIYTVVQPDLCIVCDASKIDKNGCLGSPDLIVEILSPGNTDKEMKEKFDIYQEAGVNEYWLIEPKDKIVLVYVLNTEGKYVGLRPFTSSDTLTSSQFKGFELNLNDVFN